MPILKKLFVVGIILFLAGLGVAIYTQGAPFSGGPANNSKANLYFSSDATSNMSTTLSKRPNDTFTVRPYFDLGTGIHALVGHNAISDPVNVQLAGYQMSITFDPTLIQMVNPSASTCSNPASNPSFGGVTPPFDDCATGYTIGPLDGMGNLISNSQGLITLKVTPYPGTSNPTGIIALPKLTFQAQPRQSTGTAAINFSQTVSNPTVFTSSDFGGSGPASSIPFNTTSISVTVVNNAPTVAPTSLAFTEGDSPAPINITSTDTDNDITSIAINSLGTAGSGLGATFTGGSGTGTANGTLTIPTIAFGKAGSYSLSVTATDNKGATTPQIINITVNGSNHAPTISPIGDVTMTEGGSQTVAINASDVDLAKNDAVVRGLTYSLAITPSNTELTTPSTAFISPQSGALTINSTDGTAQLNVNPGNRAAGVYMVTVTVNDDDNSTPAGPMSIATSFTITVNNKLPVITVTGSGALPVSTNEDTGPLTFNVSSDTGLGGNNLFVLTAQFTKLTGPNAGSSPSAIPCTFQQDAVNADPNAPATGVISCSPTIANNDYGTYSVVVTSTDTDSGNLGPNTQGGISSTSGSVPYLAVAYVDRAPSLSAIGNVTLTEGGSANVDLSASDQDLIRNDGATRGLTYTTVITPGNTELAAPSTAFISPQSGSLSINAANGSAQININPGNRAAGVYNVTVTVSDNDNTTPTGSGSGPKTSAQSFTITVNNKLPVVTVTGSGALPVSTNEGTGPITFNVSSDTGVGGNNLFVLTAAFTKLSGPNAGSTPSAIPCTFAQDPVNADPNQPATGVISCSPTIVNNDYGTYSVAVTATDTDPGNLGPNTQGGISANSGPVAYLTVNYVDRAPSLAAINNVTMFEGSSQSVSLSASDLDLGRNDGATRVLTFSTNITTSKTELAVPSTAFISPQSGSLSITGTNGAGQININPGVQAAGVYTVTVTVNDNDNNGPTGSGSGPKTSVQTFTITVNNKLPIVTVTAANPAGALPTATDEGTGPVTFNVSSNTGIGGNNLYVLTAAFTKRTGASSVTSASNKIPCAFVPNAPNTDPNQPVTGVISCSPTIANNDYGTYEVIVTATDTDPGNAGPNTQGGTTTTSGVVSFLTVNYVDRAPSLTSINNITMFEGESRTVSLAATDPDLVRNDGLTRGLAYTTVITTSNTQLATPSTAFISPQSGPLAITTSNGAATINVNPGNKAAGVYTVTVTVNDNDNTSPTGTNSGPKTDAKTFTITVNNKLPVVTVTAVNPAGSLPTVTDEGTGPVTFNVSSDTGIGGNNLYVLTAAFTKRTGANSVTSAADKIPCTFTQNPANPDPNQPATGVISCTQPISLDKNFYGTYEVIMTATETEAGNNGPNTQGGNSSNSGTVSFLTVSYVDRAPVLNRPPLVDIPLDALTEQGTRTITVSEADPDLSRLDSAPRTPIYTITICAIKTELTQPNFSIFKVIEDGHVAALNTGITCANGGIAATITGNMTVNGSAGTAAVNLDIKPNGLSAGVYAITTKVDDNDNTAPKGANSGPKSDTASFTVTITNVAPVFDNSTLPASPVTVLENGTKTITIKATDIGDAPAGKTVLSFCAQVFNTVDPTTHVALPTPALLFDCGPPTSSQPPRLTVKGGGRTITRSPVGRTPKVTNAKQVTPRGSTSPGFSQFFSQTDNGNGTVTLNFNPKFSDDNAYLVKVTASEIKTENRTVFIPDTVPGVHKVTTQFALNIPDVNRSLDALINSTGDSANVDNTGFKIDLGTIKETLVDGSGNVAGCGTSNENRKLYTFTITDPDIDNNPTFTINPDPAPQGLSFVKIASQSCAIDMANNVMKCTVSLLVRPTVTQGAGARGDYAALRGLTASSITTTFDPAPFTLKFSVTDNANRDRFHPTAPDPDPTDPAGRTSVKTFDVSGLVSPYNSAPAVQPFLVGADETNDTNIAAYRVLAGAALVTPPSVENRFHIVDSNYDITHDPTKKGKPDPGTYDVSFTVTDADPLNTSAALCTQAIASSVMTVSKYDPLHPTNPPTAIATPAFMTFTPSNQNRAGVISAKPRSSATGISPDAGKYQITITVTDNGTPAFQTFRTFTMVVLDSPNFYPVVDNTGTTGTKAATNQATFADDRINNIDGAKIKLQKLDAQHNPVLDATTHLPILCDQLHPESAGCTYKAGDIIRVIVQPEAATGKRALSYDYSLALGATAPFNPIAQTFQSAGAIASLFSNPCQPKVLNNSNVSINDPATELACFDFLIPSLDADINNAQFQVKITETGNAKPSTATSSMFTMKSGLVTTPSTTLTDGATITTGPNPSVFTTTAAGNSNSFFSVLALSGDEPVPTTIIVDLSVDGQDQNFKTVEIITTSRRAQSPTISFSLDIPAKLPDGSIVNTTDATLRITVVDKFKTYDPQVFKHLKVIPAK